MRSLLLGTDVFGRAGATISFWPQMSDAADGLPGDGDIVFRDPATGRVSQALPFTHRVNTQRVVALAQSGVGVGCARVCTRERGRERGGGG